MQIGQQQYLKQYLNNRSAFDFMFDFLFEKFSCTFERGCPLEAASRRFRVDLYYKIVSGMRWIEPRRLKSIRTVDSKIVFTASVLWNWKLRTLEAAVEVAVRSQRFLTCPALREKSEKDKSNASQWAAERDSKRERDWMRSSDICSLWSANQHNQRFP